MLSSSKDLTLAGQYELYHRFSSTAASSCSPHLAKDLQSGKKFFVKLAKKTKSLDERQALLEIFRNESKILSELEHERIIKLHHYLEDVEFANPGLKPSKRDAIVLPYASNGDMFSDLERSGAYPEQIAHFYFKQLLEGMKYLAENRIAHRDLKPENLVLDQQYNLVIVDFGWATKYESNDLTDESPEEFGTEKFLPPELRRKASWNPTSVDIFSAGLILFMMAMRSYPLIFGATEDDPLYGLYMTHDKALFWRTLEERCPKTRLSPELKSLLEGLIEPDPRQRITIDEILTHQWYIQPAISSEKVHSFMSERFECVQAPSP